MLKYFVFIISFYICCGQMIPQINRGCTRTFDVQEAFDVTGPEESISESIACDCNCATGGYSLQTTKSFTRTVSVGGGITLTNAWDAITGALNANFQVSWAETTATGSTFTCTVGPGFRVWLAVRPEYAQLKGIARERGDWCNREGESTVTVPKTDQNGEIRGQRICRTERFEECPAANPPGGNNPGSGTCRAIDAFRGTHDQWCLTNCPLGNCPPSFCRCD